MANLKASAQAHPILTLGLTVGGGGALGGPVGAAIGGAIGAVLLGVAALKSTAKKITTPITSMFHGEVDPFTAPFGDDGMADPGGSMMASAIDSGDPYALGASLGDATDSDDSTGTWDSDPDMEDANTEAQFDDASQADADNAPADVATADSGSYYADGSSDSSTDSSYADPNGGAMSDSDDSTDSDDGNYDDGGGGASGGGSSGSSGSSGGGAADQGGAASGQSTNKHKHHKNHLAAKPATPAATPAAPRIVLKAGVPLAHSTAPTPAVRVAPVIHATVPLAQQVSATLTKAPLVPAPVKTIALKLTPKPAPAPAPKIVLKPGVSLAHAVPKPPAPAHPATGHPIILKHK